jgi:hypothetical protein
MTEFVDAGSGGVNNCFFLSFVVSFACHATVDTGTEMKSTVSRVLRKWREWGGEEAHRALCRVLRECAARKSFPPRACARAEQEAAAHLRDIFVCFLRAHAYSRIGPAGRPQSDVRSFLRVCDIVGGERGIRNVATRGTMVEGLVSLVPFVLQCPIRIDHCDSADARDVLFTCSFFRSCAYSPVRAAVHMAFHDHHYIAVCHPPSLIPTFEPPALSFYVRSFIAK